MPDALIEAGVDPKYLFKDKASGAKKRQTWIKSCSSFYSRW
jgi:hypothetical protein